MSNRQRWIWIVILGTAMGWMEAATVFYLRSRIDRIVPHQPNPLPNVMPVGALSFGQVELTRELATLVMLLAAGWLAGRTWRSRVSYSLIAFGLWDICYYLFLVPMSGWPASLLDWDVLFLLPLPWWGPVLAPVLIATLMIVGGSLISQYDSPERPLWPGRGALALSGLGIAVALYVFMNEAIAAVMSGQPHSLRAAPTWFNWPLFAVALTLMAAPVVDVVGQLWKTRRSAKTKHAGRESLFPTDL